MSPLSFVIWLALQIFFFMMFGRLIVELIRFNKPYWQPKEPLRALVNLTWRVTDPPLNLMRKVIPNVKLGSVGIDLSWTILMLLISIASSFIQRF